MPPDPQAQALPDQIQAIGLSSLEGMTAEQARTAILGMRKLAGPSEAITTLDKCILIPDGD